MALSPAQTSRYWREWQAVCRTQGWSPSDSAARYRLHIEHDLPKSMKDFRNRDFDRYLFTCEALKNRVDIRDRERERVTVSIQRIDDAIHLITGKRYAPGILLDMHEASDTYDLPLDPRQDQQKRGAELITPDLANLRDTLSNRLSKLLTKIKQGKIPGPPSLAWVNHCANNPAIEAIVADKIAVPFWHGRQVTYRQYTATEFAILQAHGADHAEPVQAPCTDPDPDLVPF